MVLESPYPTFEAWYEGAHVGAAVSAAAPAAPPVPTGRDSGRPAGHGKANSLLGRLFPKTYRRIDAGANIGQAKARLILVAGTRDDAVTPIGLTRHVAQRAPAGRTTYLEVDGVRHLGLFGRPEYREAVRATLAPAALPVVATHRRHAIPRS